jgi:hypothetical protein
MSQLGYHPNSSSFNKALTSSMEDWKHRGTEITEFQTMSFFSAPSVALWLCVLIWKGLPVRFERVEPIFTVAMLFIRRPKIVTRKLCVKAGRKTVSVAASLSLRTFSIFNEPRDLSVFFVEFMVVSTVLPLGTVND